MNINQLFEKCNYIFGKQKLNFDISGLSEEEFNELYDIFEETNQNYVYMSTTKQF